MVVVSAIAPQQGQVTSLDNNHITVRRRYWKRWTFMRKSATSLRERNI